ncbi:hypothetical protein DRN82_01225 [Thermococci archaeon]|nr:MAG: hypothetical protein DRN82_01225 [Thermococci archaeon]
MIKKLEIKNFRGISEGKIEGFAQLNIFIGRNNSGKSTILEALAINLDHNLIPQIVKRRGWHGFDSIFSLFRFKNVEEPIVISSDISHVTLEPAMPTTDEIQFLVETYGFMRDIIALKVTFKADNSSTKYRLYFDISGKFEKIYEQQDKKPPGDVAFIDNQSIYGKTPTNAYNMVFERGYEAHERLIEVLRTVYPDVKDIRIFSEGVGPEIVYKKGKVPFFVMGDGFRSAYIYLAYLMSVKYGYILCEEPENYQHPSSRKLIVKGICKAAKDNQIFISTHSLELIDDILLECDNIDIKFFVPTIKDGVLEYISFDREEAEFRRRELEADLRG